MKRFYLVHESLYRSPVFMIGLLVILICFAFGVRWAWMRPQRLVGHIAPVSTPNPNERIEYLEGGIVLHIPITPTPAQK